MLLRASALVTLVASAAAFVPGTLRGRPAAAALPRCTAALVEGGLDEAAVQEKLKAMRSRRGRRKSAAQPSQPVDPTTDESAARLAAGEGVAWSVDYSRAWRSMNGIPGDELSVEEGKQLLEELGLPIPDEVNKVAVPASTEPLVHRSETPQMARLREAVSDNRRQARGKALDAPAALAIRDYLNQHHTLAMLEWVLAGTELGKEVGRKNVWSRGSWVPRFAALEELELDGTLHFAVGIEERGKPGFSKHIAELKLPAPPETVDDLRVALLHLPMKDESQAAAAGAVLLRLPGSSDDWSLPLDMWLNSTPYKRDVRDMFYQDILDAMLVAVSDPACSRRMKVSVSPPELNMEMDSYRVGTLLEMVRQAALGFADLGMNTRVCVQGSMGQGAFTGVPRVLSGVRKLLSMMDWQAGPGEAHEGVLGEEEAYTRRSKGVGEGEGRIRFGEVGPAEVAGDDDVIIILAPQSMVGASIYESLSEMVEKAEAQGTSTILINPDLVDRQSANGVMSVRGRSGRIAFAESFEEIYHFRLLYSGTTFMYPILGAVRMTRAHSDGDAGRDDALYVLHQRRESDKSEEYDPVGCTPGREPTVGEISALVPSTVDARR